MWASAPPPPRNFGEIGILPWGALHDSKAKPSLLSALLCALGFIYESSGCEAWKHGMCLLAVGKWDMLCGVVAEICIRCVEPKVK